MAMKGNTSKTKDKSAAKTKKAARTFNSKSADDTKLKGQVKKATTKKKYAERSV